MFHDIVSGLAGGIRWIVSACVRAQAFAAKIWPRLTFPERGMLVATGVAFLWGAILGSSLVKTAMFAGAAITGSVLWLFGDGGASGSAIRFLTKHRRWIDWPLTILGLISIGWFGVSVGFAIVYANLLVSSGLIILSRLEDAEAPAGPSDSPA